MLADAPDRQGRKLIVAAGSEKGKYSISWKNGPEKCLGGGATGADASNCIWNKICGLW